MARMVLMKDVNNSHSILLTFSMHISWPCTFWVYFTSFYCFTFYSRLLILQELQELYFNSGFQRCVWMRCDTSWLVFHLTVDSLLLFGGQVICSLRIKKIHPDLFCLLLSWKKKMKISTLCWASQTWVYILLLFYLSSHYWINMTTSKVRKFHWTCPHIVSHVKCERNAYIPPPSNEPMPVYI